MTERAESSAGAVTYVKIGCDQVGQRIDNFLARYLKGVPRSLVYRILRSGEVRVNKGRVKPSYRLALNDHIRVPPVRAAERALTVAPEPLLTRLETSILLEDDDLIVLNKPAGLAVHGGSGLGYGLIEALRQARPHAPLLELVHRLDRDTSGCLLIAKSRGMLNTLHALLRAGAIDKRYIALVAGNWRGGACKVSAPLTRLTAHEHMTVCAQGKQAESLFTPLTHFEDCTLMEVRLGTGRMHQIRVHAAHLGHPIAGDDKYGDYTFNRLLRARRLRRMFLHATSVRFQIPNSGRRYYVMAPLDAQLKCVLQNLA
jgi:23S rRNA pseudouridine955/2504/2580 synthase